MITKEDILEIQSQLTEEEYSKFLYLLFEPEFVELKKLIKEKAKTEVIDEMRKYISIYIKKICECSEIRNETINLLIQSKSTLKNVHKLIKQKSISDANSLLRSCFENIMMAMLINYDDNTFDEFVNMSIKYNDRKYTKPSQIRRNFGKLLKKLDDNLFDEMTNEDLKNLFDDFYEGLCSFAHSTLLVNVVIEFQKDESLELWIFSLKQKAYFIETMLYMCLKYLCKSDDVTIDVTYLILCMFVLMSEIPRDELGQEKLDKLYSLMHSEKNEEYFEKNKHKKDFLINEANELNTEIEKNLLFFITILKELIK